MLRRRNSENQRRRAATIYSRATYYSRRCNNRDVARAGDLAGIIAVKPQTGVSRHCPDERDGPRWRGEQRNRNFEAECLGDLNVDHELERRGFIEGLRARL